MILYCSRHEYIIIIISFSNINFILLIVKEQNDVYYIRMFSALSFEIACALSLPCSNHNNFAYFIKIVLITD